MTVLLCQLTDVLDAKTIDVLIISDCGGDSVFGDMFRERKLNENTMYIRVMVKASDILQELGFCDVLRVVFVRGEYVCLRVSANGPSERLLPNGFYQKWHTSSAAFNFMRMYVPALG